MPFYLSIAVTLEIFTIIAAFFSEIRRHTESIAEAYVYSAVLVLSVFSVAIQLFFLLGIHSFFFVVDIVLLAVSIYLYVRNRRVLVESGRALKIFCKSHPFFSFTLAFFPLCLFIKGFFLPPLTMDSLTYHLARILMMQNDGHYFLSNFADYRQDIMPIGYDILNFLYLRFYTDYGLAFFGFLSYTIILAGIFSLTVKTFSDIRLGMIACFIGASLTMFVLNATSTKNDLVLAAVAVACFLSAYNYRATGKGLHLFVLVSALVFGLDIKFTFAAFSLPFAALYAILLFRESGFKSIMPRHTGGHHAKNLLFFVLPLGTIGLIVTLLVHNYLRYGGVTGPDFYLSLLSGKDGKTGNTLNFIRYFFQAMDLPKEIAGNLPTMLYNMIAGKYKMIGLFPKIHSVDLSGSLYPLDVSAWYGLLGLPIIISILFAAFRAKGFLRTGAVSVLIFAAVVSVTIPWTPWNGRYFALVFAYGAVCFAFMLKRIEAYSKALSRYVTGCAVVIAGATLIWQAVYVNVANMARLEYTCKNRDTAYARLYSEKGWNLFQRVPPGSSILLITATNFPIAPLLLRRPDLKITATGLSIAGGRYVEGVYREPFWLNGKTYHLYRKIQPQDLEAIKKNYDAVFLLGTQKAG